jgi:flavin reductase (DIM6/NTAB) family NADH-FMN oxidoreductase RutF
MDIKTRKKSIDFFHAIENDPVFITCEHEGIKNIMPVAWCSPAGWDEEDRVFVTIAIKKTRFTHSILDHYATKFCINKVEKNKLLRNKCIKTGSITGRAQCVGRIDKFEKFDIKTNGLKIRGSDWSIEFEIELGIKICSSHTIFVGRSIEKLV